MPAVGSAVTAVCTALICLVGASPAAGQVAGHFPPDSLVNTKVIPHDTPVNQVIGTMRNFTSDLGVRCPFCHVGEEGKSLATFDFPKDDKEKKLIARQMMRMVEEINHRLDTIPGRVKDGPQVSCRTCHRGVSRPIPLSALLVDTATASGADSALRTYRALRERYFGRDAYDFGEPTLNIAAFRLARAGKFDDALALLTYNAGFFPASSGMQVFRGNIQLMRGDTTAAAAAFREALRRDTTNAEARGRLKDIGRAP
jgi:photosynthetic reaction center cytochrome c subunit